MVALQGCKDLRQMLEIAYGKTGSRRKEIRGASRAARIRTTENTEEDE
jgi:hypothetical protein